LAVLTLPARLLAHDASLDLAALQVDAANLPTIELGRSKRLQPGQWVLALGHPWGVHGVVTLRFISRFTLHVSRFTFDPGLDVLARVRYTIVL
jgi:serine protease Do